MQKDFILEIVTEEIPTSYIGPAVEQLAALAKERLDARGLPFGDIKTCATPRRLCISIEKLQEKSTDRVEEYFGPPLKAAKDASGAFTAAAQGFASKYGVSVQKLVVKNKEKGEYLCVEKKIPGEKTEKILKDILPDIIGKLSFPKSMVWEKTKFRFARPVRSLMALYGSTAIKFSLAGIKSGNWTIGLHTLSRKKIVVSSAEKYFSLLRNNCIVVEPGKRKEDIRKAIESTAKRLKGTALMDEPLLDEVNYLVEHPVAILGSFDEKYLAIPPEVLINCMQKKQKFFAVYDSQGKLTNNFIGIRNGVSENQNIVREGYERVLSARLADAAFFFHNDLKKPLADKVKKLEGIVFHQKLGTVLDKIGRVKALAAYLNVRLRQCQPGLAADTAELERSGELAKADLVTEMVFEYPEMQGVIGRIYAEAAHESTEVCRAVEEHYWPVVAEGKLPESKTGTILALADKIDTLAGYFSIGILPSGSQDPYALRRLALGVLRIILEKKISIPLQNLVETALLAKHYTDVRTNRDAATQTMDFFRQRLENIFENDGYRYDEIRAVLAGGWEDLCDVQNRLGALKQIKTMPDFAPLAAAFKRTANILKQAKKNNLSIPATVNAALLQEKPEKELFAAVKGMEAGVHDLLHNHQYVGALQEIVKLKPEIDEFFNAVMVMAEDPQLKANRLALLSYIERLFFRILDFSQLQ